MKKSLLALAILGSVSTFASAQSSVTIFGVIDLSARSVENDDTMRQLGHSGNTTSRIGFRGVEDLGGGLKAGFWLEGALVPDDGNASGLNWQRRSTVSLMGGFGEIRLGRDYTPNFWNWSLADPFGTTGVGNATNLGLENNASQGTGGSYGTLVRTNNTIGYFLPGGLGGLYGQAMVAAGEGVPGTKHMGARIGWAAGPVNVAASFGRTEVTKDEDGDQYSVAGSYDMGFAKLSGYYGIIDVIDVKQTNWFLGASVPMGAVTLKASYGVVENVIVRQAEDVEATQIAVGMVYDLSKRTALYATYSTVDNDGTAFRVVNGGPTLTRGNDSTGYEFGIRHSF